jgi:hypothetical protein
MLPYPISGIVLISQFSGIIFCVGATLVLACRRTSSVVGACRSRHRTYGYATAEFSIERADESSAEISVSRGVFRLRRIAGVSFINRRSLSVNVVSYRTHNLLSINATTAVFASGRQVHCMSNNLCCLVCGHKRVPTIVAGWDMHDASMCGAWTAAARSDSGSQNGSTSSVALLLHTVVGMWITYHLQEYELISRYSCCHESLIKNC